MQRMRLLVLAGLIAAATAALAAPRRNSCAHGEFCTRAQHATELLETLERGVDQCFNSKQTEAIHAAQTKLEALSAKIHTATADWTKKDKQKVASDAAALSDELHKFDESPGFPASVYCRTNRKCLEAGFEADKRYPHCLPVRNDNHQNIQYLSLEDLLNDTLPKLVALLRQAS